MLDSNTTFLFAGFKRGTSARRQSPEGKTTYRSNNYFHATHSILILIFTVESIGFVHFITELIYAICCACKSTL